jgi:hypothetical protein
MYYTTFFVRARTGTPGIYYDSPPDSGYSVDNLAPQVPEWFSVAYNTGNGNELSWNECPDNDFQYFCIYRSGSEDFNVLSENLAHMTTGTHWLDDIEDGYLYSYKITAVDYAGNESSPASPESVTDAETPDIPQAFALHQNVPNPFNPSTRISFDLPAQAHVKLVIYDVSGRLVLTLVNKDMEQGHKEISWDGRDNSGRKVASGIYFYRLAAGAFTETKKMVLLK